MKKIILFATLISTVFLSTKMSASATLDLFGPVYGPLLRRTALPSEYHRLTQENQRKFDTLFPDCHMTHLAEDIAALTQEDATALTAMSTNKQYAYMKGVRRRFAVSHGLCPDAGFDFTRHMGRSDTHTSLVMSAFNALNLRTRKQVKTLNTLDEDTLKTLLNALYNVTPSMFALYSKERRTLFFERYLETRCVDKAASSLLPQEKEALVGALPLRVKLHAAGVPPETLLTCEVLEKVASIQDEARALACLTFFMQPGVITARKGAHFWQAQERLPVPYLAWLPFMYFHVTEKERHHLLSTLGQMDEDARRTYENVSSKKRWSIIHARLKKHPAPLSDPAL